MGIEIRLAWNPERIEEKKWENIYLKTLELIDNYPAMSLKSEYHRGKKRLILTRDVERNSGNKEKRFWEICGNYETRTRGESFKLYCKLNHYKKNNKNKDNSVKDEDLLFSFIDNERNYKYLFDSKTQGKDYQKLIIGIASLIENEFPRATLMAGNVDYREVKKAVKWAGQILNMNIKIPVLYDKNRLTARLNKKYKSYEIIKKAYLNYRGDTEDIFKIIFDKFDEKEIKNWYKNYLNERYDKAINPHAVKLYIIWLNITEDVNTLLRMMCVEEEGPKFEPEAALKALASTWAFVPEKYFNSILKMNKVEAEMENSAYKQIQSFFWNAMMMGRKIEVNLDILIIFRLIKNLF